MGENTYIFIDHPHECKYPFSHSKLGKLLSHEHSEQKKFP